MVKIDIDNEEVTIVGLTTVKEFKKSIDVLDAKVDNYILKESVETEFKIVNTEDGYKIKWC